MDLLRELHESSNSEYVPLIEAIDQVIAELANNGRLNESRIKSMASDLRAKGGKINNFKGARGNNKGMIGGAKDFFKANPGLTIAAGAMALDAYGKHQKAKRDTIHLHARDAQEKKMMTSIVDALKREGKFKVQKVKFERGGRTWTLRRNR